MKIVFHEKYYNSDYAGDPAAAPGPRGGIHGVDFKHLPRAPVFSV
jgi:hypothetical protein